ncbi:MAG: hypothetical protein U9N63_02480, partial [Pseudomonadota bacterium]|nr:hypothetical protein [Pseudomonadota bacterium]
CFAFQKLIFEPKLIFIGRQKKITDSSGSGDHGLYFYFLRVHHGLLKASPCSCFSSAKCR